MAFETARPLKRYSSLHELSLIRCGKWFKIPLLVQLDFNLNTSFSMNPKASLVFKTLDADKPIDPRCCFSVTHLMRWRTDISPFATFDEFLGSLIDSHCSNYEKSSRTFQEYGSSIKYINGDWTEYVEDVYRLYCNSAKERGDKLYDLSYFRALAKRIDYKLIATFFEDKMIAMFVLQEELPVLHSICCGMDNDHSSKCYAYSWLHYELIRIAIESKKYHQIDMGLKADLSKKEICFTPIPSRMDIYARGLIVRYALKGISSLITASITPDAKLRFKLRGF